MSDHGAQTTTPGIDPPRWASLYRAGRHAELADEMLGVLERFRVLRVVPLSAGDRHAVDVFCKHFLHLFTQPDFTVDRPRGLGFVALNPVIAEVVALSAFRTTDAWLALLAGQAHEPCKLLALYNARCTTRLSHAALFDTGVDLASIWYFSFMQSFRTVLCTDNGQAHLRYHLASLDPRLEVLLTLAHKACFGATYVDPRHDRVLKRHVNQRLRDWLSRRAPVCNRPDPHRIAVLTSAWFPGHSVYRCMHRFLERLARDHELTLFHLGAANPAVDGRLFAGGVKRFEAGTGVPDMSVFSPNDYGLAFYPDIGMSIESVLLSNQRIAPGQVCGYGHPVSTFGSQVDYWLGGRDVESIEHAACNYSERLLLIPGAGVTPLRPGYTPSGERPAAEPVLIGCAWASHKTNAELVRLAGRIVERCRRPVVLRVFTGLLPLTIDVVPFRDTLAERLGAEHVEVHEFQDYEAYMRALEGCHFCLDSWHFGGYATVIDALWVRRPMLTIEGHSFFNRSASHLLRAVGFGDLVVDSPDSYVARAVELVNEPERVQRLWRRLDGVDLERTVFAHDHADAFCRAIDHVLRNHGRLVASGERAPLLVD